MNRGEFTPTIDARTAPNGLRRKFPEITGSFSARRRILFRGDTLSIVSAMFCCRAGYLAGRWFHATIPAIAAGYGRRLALLFLYRFDNFETVIMLNQNSGPRLHLARFIVASPLAAFVCFCGLGQPISKLGAVPSASLFLSFNECR
jgi:hypothetical protein